MAADLESGAEDQKHEDCGAEAVEEEAIALSRLQQGATNSQDSISALVACRGV